MMKKAPWKFDGSLVSRGAFGPPQIRLKTQPAPVTMLSASTIFSGGRANDTKTIKDSGMREVSVNSLEAETLEC